MSTHRNAYILIGVGGAALATFGIAAIAGHLRPRVLRSRAHHLRASAARRAREARRAARHRDRVGDHGRDAAAARVRVGRPRRVRAVRRAAAAVQGPDRRVRSGRRRRGCRRSASTPTRSRHRLGLRPVDAGRVPRRPHRRPHGLDHAPRHRLHHAAADGHGCRVRADRAASSCTRCGRSSRSRSSSYGTNVRRYMVVTTVLGLAQGIVNWIALRHPRRARRVHLGPARVRLLLHPEHRLLHRDHPADHLRCARRRLADGDRRHRRLRRHQRRHPVGDPAACRRQGREPEPDDHVLLGAVLGGRDRPDRRDPRDPADPARAPDPRGHQPGR